MRIEHFVYIVLCAVQIKTVIIIIIIHNVFCFLSVGGSW